MGIIGSMVSGRILVSMKVVAETKLIAGIQAMVRQTAGLLSLPNDLIFKLELLTEEACLNVIHNAFEPGEDGNYTFEIIQEPNAIVIALQEQGLPYDFSACQTSEEDGLGALLMKSIADEIRVRFMGRAGQRIEMLMEVGACGFDSYLSKHEQAGLLADTSSASADIPIKIRLMHPEEALALLRCIYRVYGYSYVYDEIYFPDKIAELIRSGLAESCVAVTPENRIVGHLALLKDSLDDLVPESAQAIVDPSFRGRRIFEQMKEFMSNYAAKEGLRGMYSRAVTVHPASQKSNLRIGARETGFVLGHSPGTTVFKKIHEQNETTRRSIALFYLGVSSDPSQTVFAPPKHHQMLRGIYEQSGLTRIFAKTVDVPEKFEEPTQFTMKVKPEAGSTQLNVSVFGADFISALRTKLSLLCQRNISVVILDLPLTNPATAHYAEVVEELGFFFCGIIPEKNKGDILRLEYLNQVEIVPAEITVASEFGRELLDYVLGEKSKVENEIRNFRN